MAAVTYLVRVLPLVLIKKEITNIYVKSFLYYVPYACLAAMTVPAIFSSTSYLISAIVGLIVAIVITLLNRSMIIVALSSCAAVFITEQIIALV